MYNNNKITDDGRAMDLGIAIPPNVTRAKIIASSVDPRGLIVKP